MMSCFSEYSKQRYCQEVHTLLEEITSGAIQEALPAFTPYRKVIFKKISKKSISKNKI